MRSSTSWVCGVIVGKYLWKKIVWRIPACILGCQPCSCCVWTWWGGQQESKGGCGMRAPKPWPVAMRGSHLPTTAVGELRTSTDGVTTGEARLSFQRQAARVHASPSEGYVESYEDMGDDIPRTTSRTEVGSAKASRMNSCGIFGSAAFSILANQKCPGRWATAGW